MSGILLSRNRVQCACDVSKGPNAQFSDSKAGGSPILWDGADVELAFAFYYGASLIDISNIASVTMTATGFAANDGKLVLPERTITFAPLGGFPDAILDGSLDDASWAAGTKQHALFPFTAQEMNILDAEATEIDLWVVLTAVTTAGRTWILGYSVVKVKDSRRIVTASAVVNDPAYLNRDQVVALIEAKSGQFQSLPVWNAEQGRYVEYVSVGAAGQESLAPQTGGA